MQLSPPRRKIVRSPRQRKLILVEAIEKRRLLSVTLTGAATTSGYVKTTGFTSSSSVYVANTSKQVGSNAVTQSYSQEFGYIEFGQSYTFTSGNGNTYSYHQGTVTYNAANSSYVYPSGGGFYPSGFQVGQPSAGANIIDGATLTLVNYNSASYYPSGTGTSFELYLATNATTAPSGTNITYNTSYTTGVDTSAANTFAPIDVGAFTFSGQTSNGTYSYVLPTLSMTAQQDIATDINSGLGVRFLIGANGTGTSAFYNRFEGSFFSGGSTLISGTNTYNATPGPSPVLTLTAEQAPNPPDTFALSASKVSVNETAGNETYTINRTINASPDHGALVTYATSAGTTNPATAGTNYTAEAGSLSFSAGQTVGSVVVPIAAVFPQGGNKTFNFSLTGASTPTGAATVLASGQTEVTTIVDTSSEIDTAVNTQSIAENAGTVPIELTRTIGTGFTDSGATLTYTTSNLTGFAGTNFTGETGVASFTAGQTVAYVNVPVIDVHPMFGPKTFLFTISNPDNDSHLFYTTTTVTITDHDVTEAEGSGGSGPLVPTASGVQNITNAGPGYRGSTSYFDINGSTQTAQTPGFGTLDFNDETTNQIVIPSGEQISDIPNITLDLYSYKETGEAVGNLNVYLASDTTTDTSGNNANLQFQTDTNNSDGSSDGVGGTVNSSTGIITGSSLGTLYPIGTLSHTTTLSQSGYTAFNLQNIPVATQDLLIKELVNSSNNQDNTGKFRIVITPGSGGVVAGFNGTYTTTKGVVETPEVDIDYYTTPTAWVAAGHGSEYSSEENTLYVYGAGESGAPPTITADPGSSLDPSIVASTVSSTITGTTGNAEVFIAPTAADVDVHIGGISASASATIFMSSVDNAVAAFSTAGANPDTVFASQASDHNVLVLGKTSGTASPVFSIASTSKLDLEDNDLIIHDSTGGDLAAVNAAISEARNVAPGGEFNGTYTGNGLTSSVAAELDGSNYSASEEFVLGAGDNNEMLFPVKSWTVGSATESVGANDVLVKFTYNGDFNLDGKVNGADSVILGNDYDNNHADGNNGYDFVGGDTNFDTYVDSVDSTVFGNYYGDGTSSGNYADTL